MMTMTYGNLPVQEDFEAAFEKKCPDGIFQIRNDKRAGNYDYNAAELYNEMELALDESERGGIDDPHDGGRWTSEILSFFGFEWV